MGEVFLCAHGVCGDLPCLSWLSELPWKRGMTRRSWTRLFGGPLRSFQATELWRDGVNSRFPACPGLWGEKAETRGWLRTPKVRLSSIIRTIIV